MILLVILDNKALELNVTCGMCYFYRGGAYEKLGQGTLAAKDEDWAKKFRYQPKKGQWPE